ncbi:hypothetical protein WJU23_11085 [Prosthecobacter sp. SYSU 5D2]|uniref:hypothetical protein n=1 Tax=Prosthecobacter sp. SYSU 5D2 TaxID=3134134 RepID=UPI0031FF05FD
MKTADLPFSVLEVLEARFAPAGLVSLNLTAAGALSITGDAQNNDFIITESGDQWTISSLPGGTTEFSLNGGAAQSVLTFDAPDSVKATLGGGNDEMVLDGVLIPKTLNINTGDGDDIVELASASIFGTTKVVMGNGNDLFTAGGELYFAKGMNVNLGKGANTFDVSADTLLSDGNILATAGGTAFEGQLFAFSTGIGEVNGSLTMRTTTASFTDFIVGDFGSDSLVVTKAMTLQSAAGEDIVTLRGDLFVEGVFSMRLGNGNNSVVTTDLDELGASGLTYKGGSGVDYFLLEARDVVVDGHFAFTGGAGTNTLDLFTSEYLGITKNLTYKGGTGDDTFIVDGPTAVVTGTVSMAGSSGSNFMGINAVEGDFGSLRYTGGAGYDLVDVGEFEGGSDLISIYGPVSLRLGAGDADVQILHADIFGNLTITTNAAFGFVDEVRLFESDFRGNVNVNMSGSADSYVEVRNGIFDRNVTVSTGRGFDEIRFDTDTTVPGIYSWFDGYVRINMGAGDDIFYAGSNPAVENVGNDFNWYVDVYGGTGYDIAYFIDPVYNNGFNGPAPWVSSIEDLA